MQPSILVVDDHPRYLAAVTRMLELQLPHAAISTATDGVAALSMVARQPFDLLLIDYQLKATTGCELVRQLRARSAGAGRPLPPVVLMSTQPDVAALVRDLGIAAFLPKPLLPEDVAGTIAPLLSGDGVEPKGTRPLLWRVERPPR